MYRFVLCFTILCSLLAIQSGQPFSDSVTKIFEFLDATSKNFTLGQQKDVVIVLGNTGSGKSTLTLLLTGVELVAVETAVGSGEYVVKDKNDLISPPDQTTKSQTIIPNLLIDNELHISYYDCAGFEDSRGIDHDISVTYLIQKLLKHADSVKFVFTIAHSSVRIGGDRHDFKKLVRHATALIKNIDKYSNGIALVVTKVETKISNGQIVTDQKTIENIANFLNQTLFDLNNEDAKEQMTQFIEILLKKNFSNEFNRIQILRTPTESGPFNEMPFPKAERQAIRNMLNNTIQYVSTENTDFGYSISAESKLRVHELFKELEQTLRNDVNNIGNEIRQFFKMQETQITDKQTVLSNIALANELLPQVNSDNLKLFKEQIKNTTSILHIPISGDRLNSLDRHIEFVYFLESVSDDKLSNSFKISNEFKNTINFFVESMERIKYAFIIELKANITTDIQNYDTETKSFYLKMEMDTNDITSLNEKIRLGCEKFAEITTKNPKLFEAQLNEAISFLHVEISAHVLAQFSKHIKVLEFLDSLKSVKTHPIEIENTLVSTIQFLSESKVWYQFLLDTHNVFAEYRVQQNVVNHTAIALRDNIKRLIESDENSQLTFQSTGIKEFYDPIGTLPPALNSIQLNARKLKLFNNLLEQSLITKIDSICTSNEFVIKGNYVKISDVIGIKCDAPLIKIMAVFKTFIDAELSAPGKMLNIISPTWETIGVINLNLNGLNGTNYDSAAPNGAEGWPDQNGQPGIAGEPGRTGGTGGHFFSVGYEFINDGNLRILANAGNGGMGQNGGRGGDGIDGDTAVNDWEERNNKLVLQWTTRGATPSGIGGDGGCGGLAGLPGKFFVVGLKEPAKMSLLNNTGIEGPKGRGGTSKPTSDRGKIKTKYGRITERWTEERPLNFAPPYGVEGRNCPPRSPPMEVVVFPYSNTINEYKTYVREQLANNIFESELRRFLFVMENNQAIQSVYNINDFVNEIMSLENHYFQLHDKIDFRPFYISILNRLSAYEKTLPESDANRKVLSYLYAAALSQINSNIANQKTILNLRDYLTEAQTHITDLHVIGREIQIHDQQTQYTNDLNAKMELAKDLLSQKVFPEIDHNLNSIDSSFVALIDETIEKKKDVQANIDAYKKKLEEMERAAERRSIFGGLNILSMGLSFFGPYGKAVGGIIGVGTSIAEAASGKGVSDATMASVSSCIADLMKAFKYHDELFLHQLDDIDKALNSNDKFNVEFKDLRDELQKIKTTVENAQKLGSSIVNARRQLQELLKDKQISIEKEKPGDTSLLEVLDKAKDIARLIGMGVDVYNQIKNNKERMREVSNVIRRLETELLALQQYEEQIHKTMIPIFRAIENYLKTAKDSMSNGTSHVQLDIKKWEIKSRLGDVKHMFSQMTKASGTHDDFQHYFAKVEATMDILINVYDRIESISDHAKFVDFISKIASNGGQNITTDPQLMHTINKMDEIIQTNLVLEKHKFMVHAFKQHYFPFAPLFLDKFYLPPELCLGNVDALKERAITQIIELYRGIIISDSTLGSKDIHLFSDIQFDSDNENSAMPPFYIWKNQKNKNEIQNLLNGEEIVLKADVLHGVDKNAIKFNRIGIYLNSPNSTIQTQLNEAIKHFDLTMKMIGGTFYRCDKRVYQVPTDDKVVIEQSMKRDANGIPIKQNDVYRKISESNYFLSPYTLWSIKLENEKNNITLNQFENEIIDISLVGRGQYLKTEQSVSSDVCNDHLDKYYFLDSVSRTEI